MDGSRGCGGESHRAVGLAEKRKRSKPRRPSMTFDVGSLLTATGGDTDRSLAPTELVDDSAAASLDMWEDSVDSFMSSSQEVVQTAKVLEQVTMDFAKGTHSIEKLIASVTLIPEKDRPRALNGGMPPLNIKGSAAAKRQLRDGKSPTSQCDARAGSEGGSETPAETSSQAGAPLGNGSDSPVQLRPGSGQPALAVSPIEPPVASVRLLTGIQNMFSGFGPRQNEALAITPTSPTPAVAQSARKFSRKASHSGFNNDKDPTADADGGSLSV